MVERIRHLLHDKQLTPTQFADTIGIARPIISHILSGRNKPSLEVVQKILAAFTDLSMPWLLNGSGPMWEPATPVAPVPVTPAETPSQAPLKASNSAEGSSAGRSVGLAEENNVKARRRPSEQPTDTAALGALPFRKPAAAALPTPQRFRVAGPRAEMGAKAAPAMPQSNAEAVGTSASTPAAILPVSTSESSGLAEQSNPPAPMAAADAAAFLLQPGKAIRRIVIFYQDGSFADYQPE
jgi:transcriptional regulator with XRE-family HTH domain